MTNLYVPLTEAEVARLRELAARERRGAKEQAAYLIVDGLRRAELELKAGTVLTKAGPRR